MTTAVAPRTAGLEVSGVWGADYNKFSPPEMVKGEKVAVRRGLDHIRYWNAPGGTHLKVLRTGTLNGTIDDHDPIWALFLATPPGGKAKDAERILYVSVNWGRGYDAGELKRNILNVVRFSGHYDHVVLLIQELDEADKAPEHAVLHQALKKVFEKGTKSVAWNTHEPIVLSAPMKVTKRKVVVTMKSGLELDPPAPEGTGPTRHGVGCVFELKTKTGLVIELVAGNTHPHRNLKIKTVQRALEVGDRRFSHMLEGLALAA